MKIHYIKSSNLQEHPVLKATMFSDRACQFVDRLCWPALSIDENGWERDEYDEINPMYIIFERADGTHAASMRILPMNGKNMLRDHFKQLTVPKVLMQRSVWECSRFVTARDAPRNVHAALFVAANELFKRNKVDTMLGLFSKPMLRVYQQQKNAPKVIDTAMINGEWHGVGAWTFSAEVWWRSLARLGISASQSEKWYLDSEFASDSFKFANPASVICG